jgi:23S rRNA pseudouridine1911/1915/1917 synthase
MADEYDKDSKQSNTGFDWKSRPSVDQNSPKEEEDSQELFEHHRFIADTGQSPLRIDKYLIFKIQNASRNKIQQAAKAGNILVNNKTVKSNYKVKPTDEIRVVLTYPPRDTKIIPQDIPLEVVFEDKDLIVINKQAGMVVHPGFGNYDRTLLNALKYYFNSNNQDADSLLVHRIDKDTSGLMVIAKNELAQAGLARQFFYHTIERTYQALVWGDLKVDEGTIEGHIGRNPANRMQMIVFPNGEQGRSALTHYKVVKRFGYVTLVQCTLETGRTHQIRAHMRYLGHPLFNDVRYGGDKILKGTTFTKYKQFVHNCFAIIPRQALHAKVLGFEHPINHKTMHFETDLANDMRDLVKKWEKYSKHMGEEG